MERDILWDFMSTKPLYTFQSLSAQIWRHVTRPTAYAPSLQTAGTASTPQMPESYFDLIQAIFTGTAAGLFLAHPPSFGAALIQKAIVSHDAATSNKRNKQWEAAPKIFQFKDAGANCVAVGSSPRFKVYEVDFGWGKPEGVKQPLRRDGLPLPGEERRPVVWRGWRWTNHS